jgi:hypothetical protein
MVALDKAEPRQRCHGILKLEFIFISAPRDSADLPSFNRTAALRLLTSLVTLLPLDRHHAFLWQP